MSQLIPCPACTKPVHPGAYHCPACGRPIKPPITIGQLIVLFILLNVLVALIALSLGVHILR